MNGLQNRKTVAVLIVLAAGLWGGILWRLVRYTGEGKAVAPAYSPPSPVAPVGKDTLRLNYRDPFVEVLPEPECPAIKSVPVSRPVQTSPSPEEPPAFRLSGIIREGKKEFLLFEYPDGSVPVWDKGTVDGYTVGKIYADSVVVCKAGRNYTLMLN